VSIRAGGFTMGSSASESGRSNDARHHKQIVSVARAHQQAIAKQKLAEFQFIADPLFRRLKESDDVGDTWAIHVE